MDEATSRQGTKRGAGGKAKRRRGPTSSVSTGTMRKRSKLVVTFDPDKRREYLTGFHKRKQERRRYGLDMEAYKVKKRQLEAKKQRREEQREHLAALNLLPKQTEGNATDEAEEHPRDSDESEDAEERGAKAVADVRTFTDDFTQQKFGDVVTVITSVGDLECDESDSELQIVETEDDGERGASATILGLGQKKRKVHKEPHLTLFQRIQQQRKGKALPSKRSKLREARTARKKMKSKKGAYAGTGKRRGLGDNSGGSTSTRRSK
ncbi:hypothetical protein PsorP6_016034 [Peronosclerospora sorghi]|uniref:Uncharacterized protein n=1 Tax=Peronosclerospora sorghi TaxID=230839 RepID=A0ACC0WM58_9STRA|nr:hypothetical protein PsorP6_016034 [Peronosclerospora sorghi]